VVGLGGPLPRGQVASKMWEYIARIACRTRQPREILSRRPSSEGSLARKKVTMFEMNKHLAGHLK